MVLDVLNHTAEFVLWLWCHCDISVTCVQVFDQFVKSRVKDEYKEKRSKLQKAREEFKQLLEEAKITSRYFSSIIHHITLNYSVNLSPPAHLDQHVLMCVSHH